MDKWNKSEVEFASRLAESTLRLYKKRNEDFKAPAIGDLLVFIQNMSTPHNFEKRPLFYTLYAIKAFNSDQA